MDPWRSPKWVGDAHLADQSAYFQRNWWPTTTRSRLPAPVQTETRTVPSDYSPGPNNRKRIKNAREEAIETNEHQSVGIFAICCDLTRATITRLARTFQSTRTRRCREQYMPLVVFCLSHHLYVRV